MTITTTKKKSGRREMRTDVFWSVFSLPIIAAIALLAAILVPAVLWLLNHFGAK